MKLKFGIIALMLLVAFTVQTPVFAEAPADETTTTQTDDAVDTTSTEETPTEEEQDVAQSEGVYTIYVHEQCPHCKDVEKFVALNGLENNVNYIQLYNQEDNYDELITIFEENNIPEADQGWPFLIVNEDPFEYVVGGDPIIDFLTEEFNVDVVEGPKKDVSSGGKVLLGVGGIVLLGVLGYGLFSILGKEE